MGITIFIETPRLLLRSWISADTETYINMNRDPRVMEFFPSLLTEEQSLAHIERIKDQITAAGYGLYALENKADGAFIGFTGFTHPRFDAFFTPCVEIGWRIAFPYWNHGYATEAAKSCIHFGFNTIGWKDIYSFTAEKNIRSENVMKKTGMQKEGEFNHPLLPDKHPLQKHILYKISAE